MVLRFHMPSWISLVFNPNSQQYHMWNHWKKHNRKIYIDLSWETLKWNKTQQNFLCIICIRYNPKNRYSPPSSLSLSPMCYSSEWVYVQIKTTSPLFIHNDSIEFYPRQVGPTKLSGPTSPTKNQNNILHYLLGW